MGESEGVYSVTHEELQSVLKDLKEAQGLAASLVQEHSAMLANLTSTQARCTELLLENREAKRLLAKARCLANLYHPEDIVSAVDALNTEIVAMIGEANE